MKGRKSNTFGFMITVIISCGFLIVFGIILLIFLTGHTWWGRVGMASEAIVPAVFGIYIAVKAYLDERREIEKRERRV